MKKNNGSGGLFFPAVMGALFLLIIIATGRGPRFLEIIVGLVKLFLILLVGWVILVLCVK